MSLTISHTQNTLYTRCPKSYFIKYMLKLNERVVGSALPFGSSVDEALNTLLLTKDLTEAKFKFLEKWSTPEINKVVVDGNKTNLIRYSKADLDESLFTDKEIEVIIEQEERLEWHSLYKKGLMMLEAYEKQVLPLIEKVVAVQKTINIDNGIGDKITGIVDLIATMKDGRTLILDNKTSSKSYKEDAVETEGHQLALYDFALKDEYKIDGQGFIVIEKQVRKKTGIHINLIEGNVPNHLAEEVIRSMDDTLHGIKSGHFPSRHPECKSFFGPCLCQLHSTENYDNLIFTGFKK